MCSRKQMKPTRWNALNQSKNILLLGRIIGTSNGVISDCFSCQRIIQHEQPNLSESIKFKHTTFNTCLTAAIFICFLYIIYSSWDWASLTSYCLFNFQKHTDRPILENYEENSESAVSWKCYGVYEKGPCKKNEKKNVDRGTFFRKFNSTG